MSDPYRPVRRLVLDRLAPDGPSIFQDGAPPPEPGAGYHEVEMIMERAPEAPQGYKVLSCKETGKRFEYIGPVSHTNMQDQAYRSVAEVEGVKFVSCPRDLTIHRLHRL